MKVNVWRVGYATKEDFEKRDRNSIECRPMGYVDVEDGDEWWYSDAWHYVNWSCHCKEKPSNVHSPISLCGSDVIFQAENGDVYVAAKSVGWSNHTSLESAVDEIKNKGSHWVATYFE